MNVTPIHDLYLRIYDSEWPFIRYNIAQMYCTVSNTATISKLSVFL